MRATRNRVYRVTRIGGSNPSSSAIYSTVLMAVFFSASELFQASPRLAFNRRDYGGHLTPLRALPLSYVVRCSQELADKTNPEHRLVLLHFSSSAIYSTVLMAVFFRRLSCFKRRLGLLSTDGIMAWASNAVAGAAAFLRRKMFPRLADKTNRSIGWFCLRFSSSAIYSTVLMAVFFRRLSCLIKRCSVFFLISPKCRFCKRLTLLKCL